MNSRSRIAVGLLALSAAGFSAWQGSEGFTDKPMIPTQGDVPTIGHGSTRYEDGRRVTLNDKPITRERAAELARNLIDKDHTLFATSLPGVRLHQAEADLYLDFIGQYGIGNWRASSMRRELLAGNYAKACNALLKWRYAAGYDCSTTVNGKPNTRCWGVWVRQQARHAKCMAAQGVIE